MKFPAARKRTARSGVRDRTGLAKPAVALKKEARSADLAEVARKRAVAVSERKAVSRRRLQRSRRKGIPKQ
jgi:hypothetical protein